MTAEIAAGHDGSEHRPSRPSRMRKAAEKPQGDEAQLARMVRELHELEDDIASKLTAADRVLAQLASRRIHEEGGYTAWTEFEERMLATSPILRAMREAARAAPPTLGETPAAKRDALDPRGRQTRALTSMARAIERLRALDAELYQCAGDAAGKLRTIESMRVYEECGYASYEEFLERALGPSPVLANAVALASSEPVAEHRPVSPPPADLAPAEPPREAAPPDDLFSEGEALLGTALLSTKPAAAPAEQAGDPAAAPAGAAPHLVESTAPSRRTRRRAFVSVVLCGVAIVAGAAAGVGSGMATRGKLDSRTATEHAETPAVSVAKPANPAVNRTAPAPLPVTH